jgi:hypothetical protein
MGSHLFSDFRVATLSLSLGFVRSHLPADLREIEVAALVSLFQFPRLSIFNRIKGVFP